MKDFLILDFGKVLAAPTTGEWFITPCFLRIVQMDLIDKELLLKAMKKYDYILSRKLSTLVEEYDMFCEFYTKVFREIGYQPRSKEVHLIAYDITYRDDKYRFYENVKEELKALSEKYTLLLLTDNWPCVIRILQKHYLYNYFDSIYVSSIYGMEKKDGTFFDYPLKDYNINAKKVIFVDDNEDLLKIAKKRKFKVVLMDRENKVTESKYSVIHNLLELL